MTHFFAVSEGSSLNLRISLDDSGGGLATDDSSTVTLSLVGEYVNGGVVPVLGGAGSLGGPLTATVVNGVATFGSTIANLKNATYILKATDGALSAIETNLVVGPAAPTKLVFAPNTPTTGTAGVDLAITVYVEDRFGNIVTANPTPGIEVSLYVSSAPGNANVGVETAIATNGVATFPHEDLTVAGKYTLTAGSDNLGRVTTGSINIVPAAASKLVFTTPPKNSAAGKQPPMVITVEDRFGNIVTNGSVVTMAIYTGPASTLGGTRSVAPVNGVATFSSLVLSTLGTYRLEANDGTLTKATSASFVVSAATAARLAFVKEPANGARPAGHRRSRRRERRWRNHL